MKTHAERWITTSVKKSHEQITLSESQGAKEDDIFELMQSQQNQIDSLAYLVKNFINKLPNFRGRRNYRGGRNRGTRGGLSSRNRYCYICGKPCHKSKDYWYGTDNQDLSRHQAPENQRDRGKGKFRGRDKGTRQVGNNSRVLTTVN